MNKIYSGRDPQFDFPRSTHSRNIEHNVRSGHRPIRPPELISEVLWAFIKRCWDGDYQKRPVAEEVVQMLQGLNLPGIP